MWLRRGVKARRTRDEGRVRRLMAMRDERAARRTQAGSGPARSGVGRSVGPCRVRGGRHQQVVRAAGRGPRFFDARDARRSDRPRRSERRGQDDGAAACWWGSSGPTRGRVERGTNVRGRVLRSAARGARSRADGFRDGRRRQRSGDRRRTHAARVRLSRGFPVRARARAGQGEDAVGRRTQPAAAGASADAAGERPGPRRADERSGSRDAVGARSRAGWIFAGTILVVSHDRVFLENVVTNTWLFEGDGRIQEYVGTDFDRWTKTAPPRLRSSR